MFDLQVGVGRISLRLRHAASLKDKRKVIQSLVTKMRNMGCSATEASNHDNPKLGSIGFSFTGTSPTQVEERFQEVERLLWGDFEVLAFDRDVVEYSLESTPLFRDSILDEKDPEE